MLTRSGLGTLVVAVVLGGLGWWWGYEELIVAGVGLATLVVVAVWVSQRPLRATVSRRIAAVRIPRGDPIHLAYRVRNSTNFRSGSATIIDHCDGHETRVRVNPMPGGTEVEVHGVIPTMRRGIFDVGPFSVERIDPFWLALGSRRDRIISSVIVHPKVYDLVGPQGAMRVVENETVLRRATSDPMSGFVSMREYVAGDDPRMIHWPTTARTGTLMVREHVEVRRPEFTVVVDSAEHVASPIDFEEMVDVAATLAIHSIRTGLDVIVRTTSRQHPGRPTPLVTEAMVLDLLTPLQQTTSVDLLPVGSLFSGGLTHTTVLVVTGPNGPSSRLSSSDHLAAVRIGVGGTASREAILAADDALEFVRRWRSL